VRTPRLRDRRAFNRRLIGLLYALAGVFGTARPADAAPSDYLGKPIVSVRLVIEGKDTTDLALTGVIETRVGRELVMAEVRDSVVRLFSLGRFEDVKVDAAPAGRGVAIVYDLSPVHPVTRIAFVGQVDLPGIDVGQLRRAVIDRYGTSPPLGRVADLTRTIVDALRERGYLHATVQPKAERAHDPDRATLSFEIDPGARTLIGTVEIVGTPSLPGPELLKRLGLAPGAPYERTALDLEIERYIESRRKSGYYEAKLVPAVGLVDGDRIANVTLTVAPGARAQVVFSGDSLPADKRAELVPIEREGSVDEDLLEDSSRRIEDYLHDQGYRDATATHTREALADELVITFRVHKGPEYRVTAIEIAGNTAAPLADLQPVLRLREGQPFASAELGADEAAIESLYHRRGYASASARSAVEFGAAPATAEEVPVTVRIAIREGVRTVVGSVRLQDNVSVPEAALRRVLVLQPGAAFSDAALREDADRLLQAYDDLGYRTTTVDAVPNFTADLSQADPAFVIREGPRLVVGQVLIVGNVRTSRVTIERELQLKTGDPLSRAAEIETQRRLAALGLFRRTLLTELARGEESTRDLLVSVEEGPPTTVIFGGGFDVRLVANQNDSGVASQRLEFAPRASFNISRRNLFGKNRAVDFFTSVSFHPNESGEGFTFPEYRVSTTYREPHAFGTGGDAFFGGTLEQQRRSSFDFARRSASAQFVRKLTLEVSVSGGYQIQRTQVFNKRYDPSEERFVDRLFPKVRLSSFSALAAHDTRDDAIDPTSGHYLTVNGQIAAKTIGSQVGFAKTFINGQAFRRISSANRVIVAGRALLGVAHAFALDVPVPAADANAVALDALPASERYFAGGDTTVRGYALDTLGTPATKDKDGFPIGGSAVVIFNLELRAPVWNPLQAAAFVDAGNVFAHPSDIDPRAIRGAVGFGLRYKSPVGPIRIDIGFKLHRDVIAQGNREGLTALHISLGQAF
jgi:outer membrane protein assembly complex protein YaeT